MARNLVQLGGAGVHLRADRGAGLVQQVDRLVRQEAVLDVAGRQHDRVHEGLVADVHVVVLLKALLQSAQDRDRVLLRGRIHLHRLEPALQRGVLLHVLAVFVERGRADAVELAAREHRLEHVARVGRAFGLARADDGVDLVDEEDDASVRGADLVQHRLQALLELAAVLRAGHQGGQVEREDGAVLESFRHVAAHDALREPLDDGGLADARLADEDGVVLRLAAEDADDVADLRVAADDGVQLAGARELDEVRAVFLQRLVLALGIVRRHALVAAHRAQRQEEALLVDARVAQQPRARAFGPQHGQDEVLDAHVLVLHVLRRVLGERQHARQLGRDVDLVHLDVAGDPRLVVDRLLEAGRQRTRARAHLRAEIRQQSLRILHQREEHVLHVDLLLSMVLRHVLRGLQRLPYLGRIFLGVHVHLLGFKAIHGSFSTCRATGENAQEDGFPRARGRRDCDRTAHLCQGSWHDGAGHPGRASADRS